MSNIEPLADRVIIKQKKADDKKGGIIMPEAAKKKPQVGEVIAVGPGRWNENGDKTINMSVKVGETVYYASYSGTEITNGNDTLIVLSESDILAVERKS